MSRPRLTPSDLDARLKFILGIILGTILLFTTMGILYALVFVSQPVTAQSENDKMFFNVLGSVATFITGTLAGLLIGRSGAQEMINAIEEKNNNVSQGSDLSEVVEKTVDEVEEAASTKPNSQMPDELPVDEDWDKD
jgi:ABC-type multidrug transport system fused ATPase/permease subunit